MLSPTRFLSARIVVADNQPRFELQDSTESNEGAKRLATIPARATEYPSVKRSGTVEIMLCLERPCPLYFALKFSVKETGKWETSFFDRLFPIDY